MIDDDAGDVNRKKAGLYMNNDNEDNANVDDADGGDDAECDDDADGDDDDAGDVNRKKAGLSVHNEGRPRPSSLFLGLTCFILTSRSTLGLYHLRDESSLISDKKKNFFFRTAISWELRFGQAFEVEVQARSEARVWSVFLPMFCRGHEVESSSRF